MALVHARYSCDIGTHIWVSVKQSASGEIDHAVAQEGAGFGGVAAAWWDSHRGTFTCDGKRHVAWYSVDKMEEGTRGQLKKGWGYVQFCITTDNDLDLDPPAVVAGRGQPLTETELQIASQVAFGASALGGDLGSRQRPSRRDPNVTRVESSLTSKGTYLERVPGERGSNEAVL